MQPTNASATIGFGYDFSAVRTRAASCERLKFLRAPRPDIQACLPVTYGFGPEQVSVRNLGAGVRPEPARLTIGAAAVTCLKQLSVAEINVDTRGAALSLDNFGRALSLLAGNWERLIQPAQQFSLFCLLLTDDMQCSSLVKSLTDYASGRLNGELFLSLGENKLSFRSEDDRLKVEKPAVQAMFRELGLVPPTVNFDPATNPVVQFDFLRVFADGAAYEYKVRMPFEFLMARAG